MTRAASEQSAFVPVPWRSGTIDDRGLGGHAASERVELLGSSAGQSPGTSSTRSAPCSTRPATPSAAAALVAGLGGVGDDRRRRGRGERRRPRLAGDDDDSVDASSGAAR